VLAIGGLDPGGGAGVLADARAIQRAGAFACAAISVLTVQSTSGLRTATPLRARALLEAANEVLANQTVRAIKVGALGSVANARAVGELLGEHPRIPAVVDTVMIPTRGTTRLLAPRAVVTLRKFVLPRAALVTVNAPEAEVLTGRRVTNLAEAHDAVQSLLDFGCSAVLLKGGHLGGRRAVDLLALSHANGTDVVTLEAERLKLCAFHGGGCVLASLIAGHLAVHDDADLHATRARMLTKAVRWAKRVHHASLVRLCDVGGAMRVLIP
jgi:hydroxymethylpyrimidine/phosphomethylpyrimidine kinase